MLIRKARPQEGQMLTQLAFRSKAYWGYDTKLLEVWRDELTVSEEMIRDFISYVAQSGDRVVGFWCREPKEEHSAGFLFIEPDWIGKGVGRLLWEAVMADAKQRGLRYLTWEADPNAEPFYLRMGAYRIGLKASDVVEGRKLPVMRFHLD